MARQDVSTTACGCGRPIHDQAVLCAKCTASLVKMLAEMSSLLDDLDITRSRQDRIGSGNGGGSNARSVDKPLFWKQQASDAEAILSSVLLYRVRALLEARGVTLLPASSAANLRGCANLLLLNVEWVRNGEDASDFLDELRDAVANVRKVIDRAADKWYAGRCGHEDVSEDGVKHTCLEDLWARVGAEFVRCRVCMTDYQVDERRAWLIDAANDQLATSRVLTAALSRLGQPVTVAMIEGYVRRNRLVAHGQTPDGVPLYRVGDVVDICLSLAQAKEERAQKAADKKAKQKKIADTSPRDLAKVSKQA